MAANKVSFVHIFSIRQQFFFVIIKSRHALAVENEANQSLWRGGCSCSAELFRLRLAMFIGV